MTTTQTQNKDSKTNGNPTPPVSAAGTKPPTIAAGATTPPAAGSATPEAPKTPRVSRSRVFIIQGTVTEFKNAGEAMTFLNTDPTAPKEFTAIKGTRIEKKQQVSLK